MAAGFDECLPTLKRRPGSRSSHMGMWRVRGRLRRHTRTALGARKRYEDLYDSCLRLQRESAYTGQVWSNGIGAKPWTADRPTSETEVLM